MYSIIANASAQISCCICKYYCDSIFKYSGLKRKTVGIGTAVSRNTKVDFESFPESICETGIAFRGAAVRFVAAAYLMDDSVCRRLGY
ncbi:MAG TPA: hypothetical protein PLZ15_00825 [Melioribacteraceae bacterium]|nr:hypothetical protein [Melioribacteraceae bacterium]